MRTAPARRSAAAFCSLMLVLPGANLERARGATSENNKAAPAVITFSTIKATTAADILRRLYPKFRILVDSAANAIIVTASPDDVNAIRQIASTIDIKSPLTPVTQSFTLHHFEAATMIGRLTPIFKTARFSAASRHELIASATSADMQQIQGLITSLDASPSTPSPGPAATPVPDTEAIRIYQANPKRVAREVANSVHGLRVAIAGQSVVLAGPTDAVSKAKDLISVLDVPPINTRYTAVYRIKTLDAQSVASLIAKSFSNAKVTVDPSINSLSVSATAADQRRIADGIAQLDSVASQANPNGGQGGGASGAAEVYTLRAAVPNTNGGAASTTASDLAQTVTQVLQSQAPDLHANVVPNSSQIILTGNPYSVKLAKDLLGQLDVPQPLVALDTEILEVDENTAKNLGIQMTSIYGGPLSIGSVYGEVQPSPNPYTGISPPLRGLQPLTRTPFGFGVQLNLAIQHGLARVLADPRITTLSGHTATIRAGDNLSIELQSGGGVGTVATTQIQTFQTGVQLDITPIINADNLITVALHPVVNSLTGILNGIPQISTRDTQTTVSLGEDQTLIIGGLIQDNTQRTESKIPLLGDLPLVGSLFRNQTLNGDRNELIITVTPHILKSGEIANYPGPPLPAIPTPQPLPTLVPGATFPSATPLNTFLAATKQQTRGPVPTPTPLVTPTPILTPTPAPQAGVQGDVFTYGSRPSSNYASDMDPVQILYATLTPVSLSYGTAMQISAVTSSNATSLALRYDGLSTSIQSTGPGQWQSSFPFTFAGNNPKPGPITLVLTASNNAGLSASIPITVSVVPR